MEELGKKRGEQLETCSIEFGQRLAQWIGIGQHHHLLSGAERGVAAGKVVVGGEIRSGYSSIKIRWRVAILHENQKNRKRDQSEQNPKGLHHVYMNS